MTVSKDFRGATVFQNPPSVAYLQRCLVVAGLVPRETAAVMARSVYTIQPCTFIRIIMEIYQMSTLRLKALTSIMYIEMEMLSAIKIYMIRKKEKKKRKKKKRKEKANT